MAVADSESLLRPEESSLQFSDFCTMSSSVSNLKTILLVDKLNSLWPKYISDQLLCHELSRPLRSSQTGLLNVLRIQTIFREVAFSFYEPLIWNKLPENLSCALNLSTFKSVLCLPLHFIKLDLGQRIHIYLVLLFILDFFCIFS